MLVYPCGIDVSSPALRFLSARLRDLRRQRGTRWRRLTPGRQALLTLAHLRCGHTYAQLAAGFSVGTTTAYRYIAEAVDVLAALAPTLRTVRDLTDGHPDVLRAYARSPAETGKFIRSVME